MVSNHMRLSVLALIALLAACSGDSLTGVKPPPPPPPPPTPHPAIYPRPQSLVAPSARIVGTATMSDVIVENWRADSTVYVLDSIGDIVDVMLAAKVINTVDSTPVVGDTIVWSASPSTAAWAFNHHDTPGLLDSISITGEDGSTTTEFKFPATRFHSDDGDFTVITATLTDSTGAVNTVAKFYLIKSHDARVVGFFDGHYQSRFFQGGFDNDHFADGILYNNYTSPSRPFNVKDHITFAIISGADSLIAPVAIDSIKLERYGRDGRPDLTDPPACTIDPNDLFTITCPGGDLTHVEMFLDTTTTPLPIDTPSFFWFLF